MGKRPAIMEGLWRSLQAFEPPFSAFRLEPYKYAYRYNAKAYQ